MKKTTRTLAKAFFSAAILSLFLGLTSCKDETKGEDTKEVAEEQNEQNLDNNESLEDDSEFLVAAAESDLMEIEIGKLALSKGTHAEVKSFANMLVADHTKSANMMKPFAQKLGVSLPAAITEKGKERYNELNDQKAGADFDKKFAQMMVQNHEDAIQKMQNASENAKDPEIKAWAATMVPTLKAHHEHAQRLEQQIQK
ncbi:MAG TPA: DUF4142 domain-containing protein [Flavobacterium sp.]|jgi:putative membrane protein